MLPRPTRLAAFGGRDTKGRGKGQERTDKGRAGEDTRQYMPV